MIISVNDIRTLLVASSLVFLAVVFLKKRQSTKLNWAVFYNALWVLVNLGIVNYLCVNYGLWHFKEVNLLLMPYDLYFVWLVIWGIVPVYLFKGRYLIPITIGLFLIDILMMPKLEEFNVLVLNDKWLIGEVVLILLVFVPSYLWARFSILNKQIGLRALFQIEIMAAIFIVGLPFILFNYGAIDFFHCSWDPYLFQVCIIIGFPALVAVHDLVIRGKGTPFPYDPTRRLVQTGVYAYCRNPIQWSFALIFIPISIYFSSYIFLVGSVVSVAYTLGVSDYQEYPDMKKRFGLAWVNYLNKVPKWFFLWKPMGIPKGTIYFDSDCIQCNQIAEWFRKANTLELDIQPASDYPFGLIEQVTYVDHLGQKFKSVKAIACALEHINLGWATLGWFMRFPGISFVLQTIVDSMGINVKNEECEVKR